MKRLVLLFLIISVVIALGFSGQSVLAQEEITIGVSIPAATHGWTGGVNYWAERTVEKLDEENSNISFVLTTADGPEEQISDLEDLHAIHDIDVLVILPFESDPLTEPVRYLKEEGVFITVVDRGLADEDIQDLYVAGDNEGMGRVSAEYLIDRLDGSGDIVVLRGIPTVIDDIRFDAFMDEIEETDINVLDWEYANWNRDDGYEVMQDFLTRFDDIDAVWSQDDDISLGVIEAIQEVEREDEMFVVGGAGMSEIIERIMEGNELTPVTVTYPPDMISAGLEITVAHFNSETPILGEFIISAELITQDNAEMYYYPDSPF
ncbi:MAG: substrate-binding domain-containing protein [Halanaerobiaceae bacterium]